MIVLAGVEVEMLPFSALMIINMLLSVAYYLRLVYVIVLKEPTPVSERGTKAPVSLLIPILVLAALCIAIGLHPGPFIALAQQAARAVLGF